MSTLATTQPVHYPDSDGEPMSDHTLQFAWIGILMWNADARFRDDPNVFVAGDHLIYPVEGDPLTRQAPDVYVAFGPPKKDRGSYRVWEEGGVFPQVVFEVWSPGNRAEPMQDKFEFYDRFGAEEYYIACPEFPGTWRGWVRRDGNLQPVANMDGHVSPRLGFRFRVLLGEIAVFGPDGRELVRPSEIAYQRDLAEQRRLTAEREREAAEEQRTAVEDQLNAERERNAKLAAKLRELGIDPDAE